MTRPREGFISVPILTTLPVAWTGGVAAARRALPRRWGRDCEGERRNLTAEGSFPGESPDAHDGQPAGDREQPQDQRDDRKARRLRGLAWLARRCEIGRGGRLARGG